MIKHHNTSTANDSWRVYICVHTIIILLNARASPVGGMFASGCRGAAHASLSCRFTRPSAARGAGGTGTRNIRTIYIYIRSKAYFVVIAVGGLVYIYFFLFRFFRFFFPCRVDSPRWRTTRNYGWWTRSSHAARASRPVVGFFFLSCSSLPGVRPERARFYLSGFPLPLPATPMRLSLPSTRPFSSRAKSRHGDRRINTESTRRRRRRALSLSTRSIPVYIRTVAIPRGAPETPRALLLREIYCGQVIVVLVIDRFSEGRREGRSGNTIIIRIQRSLARATAASGSWRARVRARAVYPRRGRPARYTRWNPSLCGPRAGFSAFRDRYAAAAGVGAEGVGAATTVALTPRQPERYHLFIYLLFALFVWPPYAMPDKKKKTYVSTRPPPTVNLIRAGRFDANEISKSVRKTCSRRMRANKTLLDFRFRINTKDLGFLTRYSEQPTFVKTVSIRFFNVGNVRKLHFKRK